MCGWCVSSMRWASKTRRWPLHLPPATCLSATSRVRADGSPGRTTLSPTWPRRLGSHFPPSTASTWPSACPRPETDELVRQEDLEALREVRILFAAGLDERDVIRMARVWGDSTRRVAQYLPHYFHHTVEEQYRRRGLNDNDAYETALREVGLRVGSLGRGPVELAVSSSLGDIRHRASVRARRDRPRAGRCTATPDRAR